MRILITGGCGFLGHHVVEHFIKSCMHDIVVLDNLTYASNGFDRLRDIDCYDDKRVTVLTFDITKPFTKGLQQEIGDIDYILHLAAETHVDNSIKNPYPFVMTNVVGTFNVLEFARNTPGLKKMVYFSTDEVFGPAPQGVDFAEWDRYRSGNPYAATKAGGEELCMAYSNTYNVPVFVTHCMNLFGERQHPEKFIPLCIRYIMNNSEITIHSDSSCKVSGSRYYIHCRNVANALDFLLNKGEKGEKYNIVGEQEVSNLEMAQTIAVILGKDLRYKMVDFHSSRPGHDLRYALDGALMRQMGWHVPVNFDESLEKTVKWYLDNPEWLK